MPTAAGARPTTFAPAASSSRPSLRAEQLEIAEEELEEGHAEEAAEALELASLRGKIPNSAVEQSTGGIGLALIRDNFNIGASFSLFDSDYGVPGRPGAEHHHEEGGEGPEEEEAHGDVPVSINLRQKRFDLRGEYRPDSRLPRARAAAHRRRRLQAHRVRRRGRRHRVRIRRRRRPAGIRPARPRRLARRQRRAIFDAQVRCRRRRSLPSANKSRQLGLFTLQEFELGKVGLEGALRFERSHVESAPLGIERDFDALSGAVGASYEVAPQARVGINLSRTARAPSAEELFSNGPHIATQAFEIGDPDLGTEKSWGGEAYVRFDRTDHALGLTVFANRFDDFIYEAATGEEEDELPVFRYFQRDATYYGFEAEASATLFHAGGFRFVGDAVADYVRASVKGVGPVPRIPPLRLLGGHRGAVGQARRARSRSNGSPTRTALPPSKPRPTATRWSMRPSPGGRGARRKEMQLLLSANNLFDVDARRHASFTKDYVPLAGRDIRLSARLDF